MADRILHSTPADFALIDKPAANRGLDDVNDSALALRDDLWKFTVTPQVSVENVFFSRPVIYAYATCAAWGDGFKGRIGGNDTLNRLDGRAFGMQLETRCCESPCVRRSIRLNSEM